METTHRHMKRISRITKAVLLTLLPCAVLANDLKMPSDSTLSGDAKLACEAVLCLSSAAGSGTSECAPALNRYFSFTGIDAITDRLNFLNQCPLGDMPDKDAFLDDTANGAGFCTAAILNSRLTQEKCDHDYLNRHTNCKERIDNHMPKVCADWVHSQYTDLHLHYQGAPVWQDVADFMKHRVGEWVD